MTIVFVFAPIIVLLGVTFGVWHYLTQKKSGFRGPQWIGCRKANILLVTAHPDDECMFFSPTLLGLTRYGHKIYVLCLSTGNYYSLGRKREGELYESCALLCVPRKQVFIVNDSVLQDDPTVHWSKETVARYIEEKVQEYSIEMVITFDEYGVSGHRNHQSLYHGAKQALHNSNRDLKVYTLESVAWYEKYTAVLGVLWCWHRGDLVFLSDLAGVKQGQRAMIAHWSQFVWFRALYISFSQYMVINILKEMQSGKYKPS